MLLLALAEGLKTQYFLHYEDDESSLDIYETIDKFLKKKDGNLAFKPSRKISSSGQPECIATAHPTRNKIYTRNRTLFRAIHELDSFLALTPDCAILKHNWAVPLHNAMLSSDRPILGQFHLDRLGNRSVVTHLSPCALYNCLPLREFLTEESFAVQDNNPWRSLSVVRDSSLVPANGQQKTSSRFDILQVPVFNGSYVPYSYLLLALYCRELTGSERACDWPIDDPSFPWESAGDLIVEVDASDTAADLVNTYLHHVPIAFNIKDDGGRQVLLREIASQGLGKDLSIPIGGTFEHLPIDRRNPVRSPQPDLSTVGSLRPDNSGLLCIEDLRWKFAGKRCFIIGNGPSLKHTDLTRLKQEYTFGLNRIYLNYPNMGFEPTFYCCVNPKVLSQFAPEIDRLNSIKFIKRKFQSSFRNHWNTFFMESQKDVRFNEYLEELTWHEGWTVTYCAMQVAYFMGFEEVILVGVDHYFRNSGEPNKAVTATGDDTNHFHPDYFGKGVVWEYPDLERSEESYNVAKQMFEQDGRRIIDATIGGHLQIFPKKNYEEIIQKSDFLPHQNVFKQSIQKDVGTQISSISTHETNNYLSQPPSQESRIPDNRYKELSDREQSLVHRHPFPYPISLPTNKQSQNRRIQGLKRVLDIYEHKYHSVYRPRLETLRQQFMGHKRAFIIGNGPSLNKTDLSLLKNEVTFGVNGITLKSKESDFQPTFYVVEDNYVAEDRQAQINQLTASIKLFPIYLAYCFPEANDTIFFNQIPRTAYPEKYNFSRDASSCIYSDHTVTYSCLQLAYYMGFREIYLIGVDCDYTLPKDVQETQDKNVTILDMKSDDPNHFHPNYLGKEFRWHYPQVDKMIVAFREANQVCQSHGVKIYNATTEGKLEEFPRVDYNTLFSELHKFPRVLLIDMTRMGEESATGQVKQVWFGGWPSEQLLQVYALGKKAYGIQSDSALEVNDRYSNVEYVLEICDRFRPEVIYYRPVAEKSYIHDFALRVMDRLQVPIVTHIVDDWPERLRQKNLDLHAMFDTSLRTLFNRSSVRLSICDAMSKAFQKLYGQEFIAIANGVESADWLAATRAASTLKETRRSHRPFTIRYIGSLAADMTLESVLDVARAVAELQSERDVCFEIYTRKLWRKKVQSQFAGFKGVVLRKSGMSQEDYRLMLADADALLIAYNFDPHSVTYVRYSMANKLPECLASAVPVITYGPMEVATIAYVASIGCTQLIAERNLNALKASICQLIDHPEYCQNLGKAGRDYAFCHHSVQQVRSQLYELIRDAVGSQHKANKPSFKDLIKTVNSAPISSVRSVPLTVFKGGENIIERGLFSRNLHAQIDETELVYQLIQSFPTDSIMIDVGALYGGSLKQFADLGWKVFAFEPDPDNRQKLLKKIKEYPLVTVDTRAVSNRHGEKLPFYTSNESTGISGLLAFRNSHKQRCVVETTTIAQVCLDRQLKSIDFLKIDTEGFDLMVLQGVPWDRLFPKVIECEFEDRKTVPLGYNFDDLARYLTDKGYTVFVSEWHPVVRYGIQHDWCRITIYPCKLVNERSWGNLLAFRDPPDLSQVTEIVNKLVKVRSQHNNSSTEPTSSTNINQHQVRIGMNSDRVTTNGNSSLEAAPYIAPEPKPGAKGLLSRISQYYSRWPLAVAILAAGFNIASTVDTPYRAVLSGGSSALILFLIGHAASKADYNLAVGERDRVRINHIQGIADLASGLAQEANELVKETQTKAQDAMQWANRSFKRANAAMDRANAARNEARQAYQSAKSAFTPKTTIQEEVTPLSQAIDKANQTTSEIQNIQNNTRNFNVFQPLDDKFSSETIEYLVDLWLKPLNLDINRKEIEYLAHQIFLCEDLCTGELATSLQDMLLRILVVRSVRDRDLSVLEIGSSFGIHLGILYATCRDFFESIHLTAIDPLDAYYGHPLADTDTNVPITRDVFYNNLLKLDIPLEKINLLQGLSTDREILAAAGLKQYDLIVIAGDRTFDGVKFDFDSYLAAVNIGGFIIFDGYSTEQCPEVTEFIDREVKSSSCVEFVGSSWHTAVFKVVRRNLNSSLGKRDY